MTPIIEIKCEDVVMDEVSDVREFVDALKPQPIENDTT
jgi:hypothetical protein